MSDTIDCKNCTGHAVIERDIETLKKDITIINGKLETLEARMNSTEILAAKTEVKLDNILEKLNELTHTIEEYNKKPERRLDTIIAVVITAVISGGISMLLSRFWVK